MLTAAELAGMRSTSSSALPDTCIIVRESEEPTLDPVTLDSDPGETITVYEGACRVRPRGSQELDVEVGELHETLGPYVCTLPALDTDDAVIAGDPNDVRVDDFVIVETSSDAAMIDRPFRVVHVGWSAWQIDRRLGLEDRQQPQGIGAGS